MNYTQCFSFFVLFYPLWLHAKFTGFTQFYPVSLLPSTCYTSVIASSIDYLLVHLHTLHHRPYWKKAQTVWPWLQNPFSTQCFIQKGTSWSFGMFHVTLSSRWVEQNWLVVKTRLGWIGQQRCLAMHHSEFGDRVSRGGGEETGCVWSRHSLSTRVSTRR